MSAHLTSRQKLARIVFKNDTRAGHVFDMVVLGLILISVTLVILDSISSLAESAHKVFGVMEWFFTILFTFEYLLRLYSAPSRWKYVTSFYGIVDLLAILPTYIGIFVPGTQHLLIIRILRLMRIFRIFQMRHFEREGSIVASALKASRNKIIVFLVFITIASILMGALMYMVEADYNKNLKNIPDGIYWAIVTLTTVGYGDTIPVTALGKVLATIVMIFGYGIIAVPTGIVTAEISSRVLNLGKRLKLQCTNCGDADHLRDSSFCHTCGTELPADEKN